ncbi:hypothetical protein [Variovorax sp. 38R]|uniref:hypothetical protein n=1 Tax=Variovorax sp. 38R TaxID=2774875 RepID=UPI00178025C8|nr:hypothetical protein [Variovorax sp. 38R]QOF76067.1 hypothetical protein IG196_16785 [Variovorax sp. 38R]
MKLEELGFWYRLRMTHANGLIELSDPVHNLVPVEGRTYLLNTGFKGVAAAPNWYIGLYSGDYSPTGLETAATFGALATEFTAYSSATRVPWVPGTVVNGSVDNAASLSEFIFTTNATVRGSVLVSASSKGSTAGVLGSIVRFPSPMAGAIGSKLSVLAGPTAQSIA